LLLGSLDTCEDVFHLNKEEVMAAQTVGRATSLAPQDVIAKSVTFFSQSGWGTTSQSDRAATYDRRIVPARAIIATAVVLALTLVLAATVSGLFLALFFLVFMGMFWPIVVMSRKRVVSVTAEANGSGSQVEVVFPPTAQKHVNQFLSSLA